MSLINRVASLFKREKPTQQQRTTATEMRPPSRPTAGLAQFRADTERRKVIKACRKMYDQDTRAKRSIRTLARDIVGGGFEITVTGGGNPVVNTASDVAQALLKRLALETKLDDWLRLTIRDGDSFLEVGIDEQMEIAEITRKPTLQMRRNSDEFDRFKDPAKAFWWADEMWIGQGAPQGAVWFAAWQIVHARWDHDEGSRYGTPMFASGTGAWKRVTEGETDIAVRRKTRAGMKYLHVVEGASEADLETYKEQNKAALDNPFAAVADFFANKPGAIQSVQGDAKLSEIGDVQHHISTWMMGSDVPMELLGYGENLNRDVLGEKKEEYDETLQTLRGWAEKEILVPLLELQWLLAGIWPDGLEYEVKWKAKQILKAADLRDVADAALKLRALGWPDDRIAGAIGQFLPGVDLSFMLAPTGSTDGTDEMEGAPENVADAADAMQPPPQPSPSGGGGG